MSAPSNSQQQGNHPQEVFLQEQGCPPQQGDLPQHEQSIQQGYPEEQGCSAEQGYQQKQEWNKEQEHSPEKEYPTGKEYPPEQGYPPQQGSPTQQWLPPDQVCPAEQGNLPEEDCTTQQGCPPQKECPTKQEYLPEPGCSSQLEYPPQSPPPAYDEKQVVEVAPITSTIDRDAQEPPKDYMELAIFVTLCCCFPLGLVACIEACEVQSRFKSGDYDGAEESSKAAKSWSMGGLLCGVITWVMGVIFPVLYMLLVLDSPESGIRFGFSYGHDTLPVDNNMNDIMDDTSLSYDYSDSTGYFWNGFGSF